MIIGINLGEKVGGWNPIAGVEPGGLIEVYVSPMFMKLNMIKN